MSEVGDFLAAVTPPGVHMTLVAIDATSGAIAGHAFTRESIPAAAEWAAGHADRNLYWSVNPLKAALDKKPTKADVAEMRWVHVDIDDAADAVLARLRAFVPAPTLILFSGGGYQAFWRLREPIYANGNIAELEAANKAVLKALGGDKSAWNLDRIMRLPGTMNWPTATKLKKGRNPVAARVIEHHAERGYTLGDFGGLKAVPAGAPCKKDRSADLMAGVAKAIRSGQTDDEVHTAFDSHPHAADQSDPARAVQRCIDKARREAEDFVERINQRHALVWVEGALRVLWKGEWNGGLPRLSSVEDIKKFWQPLGPKAVDAWLGSDRRALYDQIVFRPGVEDVGQNFNLWRGWGMEPVSGDCSLILAHMRDVLCAGDDGLFEYFEQWCANIVQRPAEKPGTAVAMRSGQGAGKGAFFRYVRPIFGKHCLQLAGSELLLGRFNDIFAGQLLVFADEAAWPGDKRGLDKLKSYITEPRVAIERKFVPAFEIDNYARFIFATNRDHAAPAEIDDRRYVMLDVSNARIGDAAYWAALEHERQNDGPAALLHHWLHEVELTLNLRSTPKTAALTQQKLLGLDHVGQFWRAMLMEERHVLLKGYGERTEQAWFKFGQAVTTARLHEFFVDFARRMQFRYPESLDALGRALKRYVTLARREVRADEREALGLGREERARVYELPDLAEARRQFEAAVGQGVDWEDDPGEGL